MANNNGLYDAVVCGVSGGCHEAWITNPLAASYLGFSNAATAIATRVDAGILPIVGGPSEAQINLMVSITNGVLAGRNITDVTPANYANIALAIIALFTEISAVSLLGLPPGSVGNNPLSNIFYVDLGTTVPAAEQNGSIGTPFTLITDAIAAIVAIGGEGTILLTPGNYVPQGNINILAAQFITLIGLKPSIDLPGSFGSITEPGVDLADIDVAVTGNLIISGIDCQVLNLTDITSVCLAIGSGTNDVTGAGTLFGDNTSFGSTIDCSTISAKDCSFVNNISCSTGLSCALRRCSAAGAFNFEFTGLAGAIVVDSNTNFYFLDQITLINGTLTTVDDDFGSLAIQRVLYVDMYTTVPAVYQNGNINRPFDDIQAAIDALPSPSGGTILIAPGNYVGVLTIIVDLEKVQLRGIPRWQSSEVFGIPTTQQVIITGALSVIPVVGGSNVALDLVDLLINGNVICGSSGAGEISYLYADTVTFGGTIEIDSPTGAANERAVLKNSMVNSVAGAVTFVGVGVGHLWLDDKSFQQFWNASGATLVNGDINPTEQLSMFDRLTVAVPLLGADATGAVNATTVGTRLAGLVTVNVRQTVVANPVADLAVPGAASGFLVNTYISALDTIRFLFRGTLGGGNADFDTQITWSPL
jgi:hypothetical protein